MKVEVICPNGHKIPDESEGSLSFSPLGTDRLIVEVECFKCGLEWGMSLKLFTCDKRKLSGGDGNSDFFRS
ncbi:hypothetical protein HQ563_05930 [bacterium]|nr:hypothetical protein [bacterium]